MIIRIRIHINVMQIYNTDLPCVNQDTESELQTEQKSYPKLKKKLDELYLVVHDSLGKRNVAHPVDGIGIRASLQQLASHRYRLLRPVHRQAQMQRGVASNTRNN